MTFLKRAKAGGLTRWSGIIPALNGRLRERHDYWFKSRNTSKYKAAE